MYAFIGQDSLRGGFQLTLSTQLLFTAVPRDVSRSLIVGESGSSVGNSETDKIEINVFVYVLHFL